MNFSKCVRIGIAGSTLVLGATLLEPGVAMAGIDQTQSPSMITNPSSVGQKWLYWLGVNSDIYQSTYSAGAFGAPRDMGWQSSTAPGAGIDDSGNRWVFWTYQGQIYESWTTSSGWSGPKNQGWAADSAPSVAVNPTNDNQYVFWLYNGTIHEAWYSGTWYTKDQGWASASAPTVAVNDSDQQQVFWRKSDGYIYEAWYGNGSWSGPQQKWSGSSGDAPSVTANPTNTNQFVYWKASSSGQITEAKYTGTWSSPATVGAGFATVSSPSGNAADSNAEYLAWEDPSSGEIDYATNSSGSWTGASDTGQSMSLPVATNSIYETSTNSTTLFNQGASAGTSTLTGLVVLDFGKAAVSGSTYGTIDFGGHFDSLSSLVTAVENFVNGYEQDAAPGDQLIVAIGSNNCYTNQGSCGTTTVSNFAQWGADWAAGVNSFQSWLNGSGDSSVIYAAAGYDAEPAWDGSYTDTQQVDDNFNSNSLNQLWDVGSLDPGYWSNSWMYHIAYGNADNLPSPEAYNSAVTQEWANLASWSVTNEPSKPMAITSVSSEDGAGGTFTDAQSYNTMVSDMLACGSCRHATIIFETNF
jgi:hypothetical protein